MSDEGPYRRFVGKPMVWIGVVWMVLGVAWLVMALMDPSWFRAVLAAFWLIAGGLLTAVALRDKRLGLGRYRR